MKLLLIAIFLLIATTTMVESFLISALIGFKIGYALASRNRGGGWGRRSYGRSRWGRSIEGSDDDNSVQIEQVMLQASLEDNDDCAKAYVCYVHAKPARASAMEEFVYEYFGGSSKETAMLKAFLPQGSSAGLSVIDVTTPTVQFDLAAQIGKVGGAQQCQKIYAQCPLPYNELVNVLEGKLAPQPIQQN